MTCKLRESITKLPRVLDWLKILDQIHEGVIRRTDQVLLLTRNRAFEDLTQHRSRSAQEEAPFSSKPKISHVHMEEIRKMDPTQRDWCAR